MSDNLETGKIEVNIEEIIQEIRREIQEKGYKETDLSFSDIPIPEARSGQASAVSMGYTQEDLKNILDYLNANYLHDIMLPFESGNPVAAVFKKAVRKMVRFLFYPVLAQQNAFNGSVVNALNILAAGSEAENESARIIAELQEKVEALESELDRLRRQEV